MEDRRSYQQHAFAEALAPYGVERAPGPYTKLSISLPKDLIDLLRGAAAERGVSVSSMVAALIRWALEDSEQARLDAAIEAQNEENLDWAKAYLPIAAKLWSEIEW